MGLTGYVLAGGVVVGLVWGGYQALWPSASNLVGQTSASAEGDKKIVLAAGHDGTPAAETEQRPPLPADGHGSIAERIAKLESEVALLRRRLREQADSISGLSVHHPQAEAWEQELDPAQYELEQTLAEEDAERARVDRLAMIEASLQQEITDSEWADQATDVIAQALAVEELAGTSVFDVQCRATLCRMEVKHEAAESFSAFQTWFPLRVAETFPRLAMDHEELGDGHMSTVVYLARDGYSMPK